MSSLSDSYQSFSDLAKAQVEGADYGVTVQAQPQSAVAVIAPHGGSIEQYTSEVARLIAGTEFNLYLLEGIRSSGNYAALHLTSHRFDEPRCLELISQCDHVVAIHGCGGNSHRVLLGGLDVALKRELGEAIARIGVQVDLDGHQFLAIDPKNICNRGRRGIGAQIEMSLGLRLNGPRDAVAAAVRSVLLALPSATRGTR